jgi:hypothetical protein
VPEGRFAAIAANLGPGSLGFMQYQIGAAGKLDVPHFWMADGQATSSAGDSWLTSARHPRGQNR